MKRLTFIWLAIAIVMASGLFVLKHKVQQAEIRLAEINARILGDQEAMHVLRAEWAYLNQPARIEDLATRLLALRPLKPEQVSTYAGLPPAEDAMEAPVVGVTRRPAPALAAAIVEEGSTSGPGWLETDASEEEPRR